MGKEEIFNYVMETPGNTNPNVLRSLLDNYSDGTTVEPSDVNFFDYDGTLVDSYTAEEFAALSALPENPTHDGLTAQGWNWSLSDAKTYVASYGKLQVGQMYVTDDGKTRVYISLPGAALSPTLRLAVDGSAEVDWGDDSTADTLTGSSTSTAVTIQHTYAAPGDYCISIDVTGTAALIGSSPMGDRYVGIFVGGYIYFIKKVEIGNNIANIGNYSFNANSNLQAITIPYGVTSIAAQAFYGCNKIPSVTIPSGVTSIGDSAFNSCYSLLSVSIPSGVTSIGNYAFSNCYSLLSVSIPSGVTSIGSESFKACRSLRDIRLPIGVTSIGNSAFNACNSLPNISLPSGVTSVGNNSFTSCFALSSIDLPDGITSIGSYAFSNCGALSSVDLPDGITSIGNNTFDSCEGLSSVTIPSGVTSIGNYAFNSCKALSSITIPDSVTSLGSRCFYNASSLASITFKPTTPPTASGYPRWGDELPTTCIIYVPYSEDHSVLDAYKAASGYPSPSTYTYMEEPAS